MRVCRCSSQQQAGTSQQWKNYAQTYANRYYQVLRHMHLLASTAAVSITRYSYWSTYQSAAVFLFVSRVPPLACLCMQVQPGISASLGGALTGPDHDCKMDGCSYTGKQALLAVAAAAAISGHPVCSTHAWSLVQVMELL